MCSIFQLIRSKSLDGFAKVPPKSIVCVANIFVGRQMRLDKYTRILLLC